MRNRSTVRIVRNRNFTMSRAGVFGFIKEQFHGLSINSSTITGEYTAGFMHRNYIAYMEKTFKDGELI